MARFWVEFISRDFVESAQTIDAPTPIEAAQKAASGAVTARRAEGDWIKVTPVWRSTAFEFVRSEIQKPAVDNTVPPYCWIWNDSLRA